MLWNLFKWMDFSDRQFNAATWCNAKRCLTTAPHGVRLWELRYSIPHYAMPKRKKKSNSLRVSYPSSRRRKRKSHWSSEFEDGLEAGFEASEIFVDAVFAILRLF